MLDNTMPVDKCFNIIDEFLQYSDGGDQPHTAAYIINNSYNTVSYTFLYTEPINMWRKKISYEKT